MLSTLTTIESGWLSSRLRSFCLGRAGIFFFYWGVASQEYIYPRVIQQREGRACGAEEHAHARYVFVWYFCGGDELRFRVVLVPRSLRSARGRGLIEGMGEHRTAASNMCDSTSNMAGLGYGNL